MKRKCITTIDVTPHHKMRHKSERNVPIKSKMCKNCQNIKENRFSLQANHPVLIFSKYNDTVRGFICIVNSVYYFLLVILMQTTCNVKKCNL